ncbi:MAG: ATP synthase F1 subunit delta [Candidatus Abyssubacteria bacterium]|nr:ATP synthase F1 subunit delta [Candidatus Abyssubacteria bacterium]
MKADPIVSAYAEALFRLASAEEMADRVEEELHELERLYLGNAEMKEFINNPRIRAEGKKDALVELLGGKLSSVTLNHVHLIIDRERGRMLPKIAEEYYRLAGEARAKITAEVVTALPISDSSREKLGEQLGRLTKKDVYLRTRVDESILAGAIVRIGDKVLDGSVRNKLNQLKKQIVG